MARERLCWLHPDDEPECWTADPVGVRNEHDQVIPACRDCGTNLEDQSRIRDASQITVGLPW